MKKLLITLSLGLLLSTTAFSAVECEKKGKYWRPKNEIAKEIAAHLRVTTCTGGKFRALVAKSGQKFNVPAKSIRMSEAELLKKLKK